MFDSVTSEKWSCYDWKTKLFYSIDKVLKSWLNPFPIVGHKLQIISGSRTFSSFASPRRSPYSPTFGWSLSWSGPRPARWRSGRPSSPSSSSPSWCAWPTPATRATWTPSSVRRTLPSWATSSSSLSWATFSQVRVSTSFQAAALSVLSSVLCLVGE